MNKKKLEIEKSNFSVLADFIMKDKGIQMTHFSNSNCLRCGKIKKEMIKIGAFVLCNECSFDLFENCSPIDPKSPRGEIYYKWLKIYKNLNDI